MSKHLLFVCISVLLLGCNIRYQDVEFKQVDTVIVEHTDDNTIVIDLFLVLHNPNTFGVDLSKADLVLHLNDTEVTHLRQTLDARMKPNANFDLPVRFDVSLDDIEMPKGLVGTLLTTLFNKKVSYTVSGTIKAGKGRIKLPVSIDYSGDLDLT